MSQFLFRFLFIALPLLSGVFLPLFKFGDLGRLVNLFWGSVYGLGYLVTGYVFGGLHSRPTLIVGGLVWPLVVCVLLFWCSGKLWHQNSATVKVVSGVIFLLSLFVVITLSRANTPPFSSFPLFTLFEGAAY
jgi:hypothetical protein